MWWYTISFKLYVIVVYYVLADCMVCLSDENKEYLRAYLHCNRLKYRMVRLRYKILKQAYNQ